MTAALILGATAAVAQVQPQATIQVSKTVITEGETITITNTDDDASRCEGGLVVILVDGAPLGPGYNQLLVDPDVNGDWSTTWTSPIQSEWSNAYVLGPFTFNALCTTNVSAPVATPAAQPEFDYQPVVVTIAAADTTTTSTPAPAVAAAAETAPAFTG